MPTAIEDQLPPGADAPVVAFDGVTATLTYADDATYAARVSADVEALRVVADLALVESWTDAAAPLVVCLRYALAPAVAPVPASPPRRR